MASIIGGKMSSIVGNFPQDGGRGADFLHGDIVGEVVFELYAPFLLSPGYIL